MSTNRKIPATKKRFNIDRILAIVALVTIVIAWVAGSARAKSDLLPAVKQAVPGAASVERINDELYAAYQDETKTEMIGYVAIAEADGYGGPLTMAVGVDPEGVVIGVVIADHKETPAWMKRVMGSAASHAGSSNDPSTRMGPIARVARALGLGSDSGSDPASPRAWAQSPPGEREVRAGRRKNKKTALRVAAVGEKGNGLTVHPVSAVSAVTSLKR